MLKTSVLITALFVLASVVSFVNQLLIARYFGAAASVDAYLLAISVPTLAMGLLSSLLGYSLTPMVVSQQSDSSTYERFLRAAIFVWCFVTVSVSVVGVASAEHFVSAFGTQIPASEKQTAVLLGRIAWCAAGLMMLVGFVSAVLNAEKQFLLPAFVTVLPPACSAVAIITMGERFGTLVLPAGMTAGAVVSLIVLLFRAESIFSSLGRANSSVGASRAVLRHFAKSPLVLLSTVCFSAYVVIDPILASRLGEGDLSYLGYSQRLLIAIGNVIVIGPFTILGTHLAEMWGRESKDGFYADTGAAIKLLVIFGAPVTLLVSLLAGPIVSLMFQRGEFDARATHGVASVLRVLMFGMTPMLMVAILFRAFYARADYKSVAALGASWTGLYMCLGYLMSAGIGVLGIAYAYVIAWWVVFIVAAVLIFGMPTILGATRSVFVFCGKTAAALLVAGLVAAEMGAWLIQPKSSTGLLRFGVTVTMVFSTGASTYWILATYAFDCMGRRRRSHDTHRG